MRGEHIGVQISVLSEITGFQCEIEPDLVSSIRLEDIEFDADYMDENSDP